MWFSTKYDKLNEGVTVYDVFSTALAEHGYSAVGGSFVTGIVRPDGSMLSQKDRGEYSGWMYAVNGAIPNIVMTQYYLKNGDNIVFFYTDDYTKLTGMSTSYTPDDVIKLIDAIGTVTKDSADKITAARKAYDSLSQADKGRVSNRNTLFEAERAYAAIIKNNQKKLDIYTITGDYIEKDDDEKLAAFGSEWLVIGLARSGRDIPGEYYKAIEKYVDEHIDGSGRLDVKRSSDNSRLILALTALLLTGCAGSPGQSAAALAPAESDRVVIYTSHKEEVYGPIVKEFEARTGIWAEVVTGGTNELLARIAGEANAPVCNVIFGGGVESLTAYERYFQPYACAEADLIRPGLRPADDLWTPFSSLPVVLIYNTKLVSPGELTGWESLLSGRWSGSIALADPTVSGSSYTAAATMLCAIPGDDWDQLDRLAVQLEGRVLPDSGDVVAAVAGGSCRVGVTLEETALKRQAQGADIAIVYPEEGTSAVPDGSALIAGAPHPDNARAFLDFAQSRDVQELVVSQFSRRSVRTDVSDGDALPPADELHAADAQHLPPFADPQRGGRRRDAA